jgi:ferredoxin
VIGFLAKRFEVLEEASHKNKEIEGHIPLKETMTNKALTIKVKSLAKDLGIDLIGVAPSERFKEAPPSARPEAILPAARSVLSMAIRMNKTIQNVHLAHNTYDPFSRFGHTLLAYKMDSIANEVANFLEDNGYSACPIPADSDLLPALTQPLISHRHAAVAAGLGYIGWSNNLVTPEFGAGIKLSTIITSASLIPDSFPPTDSCRRCAACVEICPVEAIHPTESESFILDGRSFEHGRYSKLKCLWSCLGFIQGLEGRHTNYARAAKPLPLPEGNEISPELFEIITTNGNYSSAPVLCGLCLVVCHPAGSVGRKNNFN